MPKGKKPLTELQILQHKQRDYRTTIAQLEAKLKEERTTRERLEEELRRRPTSAYCEQLEAKNKELENSLFHYGNIEKRIEGKEAEILKIESVVKEMFELNEYQLIKGPKYKHMAFVGHAAWSASIYKDDEKRSVNRGVFYPPAESWYLQLYRISSDVEDLIIAGLPIRNLEILSPHVKNVTVLSYDPTTIQTPEGIRVLHPNQYFREKDYVYERLGLLTQIIDGKDVSASPDIIEEAKLIAKKSSDIVRKMKLTYDEPWYLENFDLSELKIRLAVHGTIDEDRIKRRATEVY
jgi:hypothetical protein